MKGGKNVKYVKQNTEFLLKRAQYSDACVICDFPAIIF